MQWYYVESGARIGPVAGDEMARLIAAGRIEPDTHVWRSGLQEWETAALHFRFPAAGGEVPPPMPSGSAGGRRERRLDRYTPPGAARDAPAEAGLTGPDGLYIHAPSRAFGEAIGICFRRYFGFAGRASRSEYWFFILFTVLLGIGASILDAALLDVPMSDESAGPINTVTTLAVFIPTLAVAWRRLHDTGRSGWWIGGFWLAMLAALLLMFMSMGAVIFSPEAMGGLVLLFGMLMIGVLVYLIVMLVFMVQRGDPGPNRYG